MFVNIPIPITVDIYIRISIWWLVTLWETVQLRQVVVQCRSENARSVLMSARICTVVASIWENCAAHQCHLNQLEFIRFLPSFCLTCDSFQACHPIVQFYLIVQCYPNVQCYANITVIEGVCLHWISYLKKHSNCKIANATKL